MERMSEMTKTLIFTRKWCYSLCIPCVKDIPEPSSQSRIYQTKDGVCLHHNNSFKLNIRKFCMTVRWNSFLTQRSTEHQHILFLFVAMRIRTCTLKVITCLKKYINCQSHLNAHHSLRGFIQIWPQLSHDLQLPKGPNLTMSFNWSVKCVANLTDLY